jgi:serine/threonine-protein kinase
MQDDLANGDTLADDRTATLTDDSLGATLAQDSVVTSGNTAQLVQVRSSGGASAPAAPATPAPATPAPTTSTLRTTVLPRGVIARTGSTPHLATDGKPRYELSHRLGQGGVGDVMKARDNDIEREVAIKRIRADVKSHATVMRFAEEVRTIGNLEHPNIVPIHDVGLDHEGDYFFVMKYVHGETLEQIIEKLAAGDPRAHAHYGFERRVEIMMSVMEAIAYAHANGIIHRDIKPANVMVGPYGEVMVMDWGLARKIKGDEPRHPDAPSNPDASGSRRLFQTQVGTLLGTPAYMSPEQARGEALTEKSDIYSLSVMFYELLTLKHPLGDKTTLESMLSGVQNDPVTPAYSIVSSVQPRVGADLAWFLIAGLEKDPAKRFSSVDAMLERLRLRAEGVIPIQCSFTLSMRIVSMWRRALSNHPIKAMTALSILTLWVLAATVLTVVHAVR